MLNRRPKKTIPHTEITNRMLPRTIKTRNMVWYAESDASDMVVRCCGSLYFSRLSTPITTRGTPNPAPRRKQIIICATLLDDSEVIFSEFLFLSVFNIYWNRIKNRIQIFDNIQDWHTLPVPVSQ